MHGFLNMESLLCGVLFFTFQGPWLSVKSETVGETDLDARANGSRNRGHIDEILRLNTTVDITQENLFKETIRAVKRIYKEDIKPLEDAYTFTDIGFSKVSDAELESNPMILLLGPWSAGKSTLINYLIGQNEDHWLETGAQPVTSDFTVVMHGPKYKRTEGIVLATDGGQSFGSLEKYGKGFLERFRGIQIPSKILEKMTFVDTPGIIENRKQQERGYPFNEVCDWFIKRAALILVVFDPTKLDIGTELESIFKQLKGHESQIRIIFNKADSMHPQELMRVYGALFWSLAPLIQVTEPPKVYVGSFWDRPLREGTFHSLFQAEERSLLQDMNNVVVNQLENKIATIRSRAILVRIHALIVDAFLKTFEENKPSALLGDRTGFWEQIVDNPDNFHIFQKVVTTNLNISKYDLPDQSLYKNYFAIHPLDTLKQTMSHCPFFGKCPLTNIEDAIFGKLPRLLEQVQHAKQSPNCDEHNVCHIGLDRENKYRKPRN